MRKVTVTLAEDVALWIRIEAAKQETSVSRSVGEMLRERMQAGAAYEEARRQFFSIAPQPLGASGTPPSFREEVHDRASFR
jgi:hypothetical protein